jgi:hypothetical protein
MLSEYFNNEILDEENKRVLWTTEGKWGKTNFFYYYYLAKIKEQKFEN